MKAKKRTVAPKPESLTQVLSRVDLSKLSEDSPEYQTARRELDNAMYAAGVYQEALRPWLKIDAEWKTAEGERKLLLGLARGEAMRNSSDIGKALATAETFEERERIRGAAEEARMAQEARDLADRKAGAERELAASRVKEARIQTEAREREIRARQAQDDLHTLAEATRVNSSTAAKRARVNRRNAKLGGAPLKDNLPLVEKAVAGVRMRLSNNPCLSMKRACELECKEKALSIKWPALRKHVTKHRRLRVTN